MEEAEEEIKRIKELIGEGGKLKIEEMKEEKEEQKKEEKEEMIK